MQKNGAGIVSATSATYTKANATYQDSGTYTVVITGTCGNITSNAVKVAINPPFTILATTPPAICQGASINLAGYITVDGGTLMYFADTTST